MSRAWIIREVVLPDHAGEGPGPVHSIVVDSDNNLYLSDEFNHLVVCLDANGALRWRWGGPGRDPGLLRYPKGIDLGIVQHSGALMPCLAVCDSWNRRVQILNRDGFLIETWGRAGENEFTDVCDIRFLATTEGSGAGGGRWLVLDRGRHRLYALGLSGELISQVGSPLPQGFFDYYACKRTSDFSWQIATGVLAALPIIDATFLPTRILGKFERDIYIYEPLTNSLKQLFLGSLIPITLKPPDYGEYLESNAEGLLAWNLGKSRLLRYCFGSARWLGLAISGKPIAVHGHADRLWLQSGARLELMDWPLEESSGAQCGNSRFFPALSETAKYAAEEAYRSSELEGLSRDLVACLQEMRPNPFPRPRGAVDPEITPARLGPPIEHLSRTLQNHRIDRSRSGAALARLSFPTYHFYLCARVLQRMAPRSISDEIRVTVLPLARVLAATSSELQGLLDDINITRVWLQYGPAAGIELQGTIQALIAVETSLAELLGNLFPIALILTGSTNLSVEQPEAKPRRPTEFFWFQESASSRKQKALRSESDILEEVQRIRLGDQDHTEPLHPYALARNSDDHLFVIPVQGGRIYHLSAEGTLLGTLSLPEMPGWHSNLHLRGIAVDSRDRFWVSIDNQLGILNHSESGGNSLIVEQTMDLSLRVPQAICSIPGGRMLVSDMGNSRLLSVDDLGNCSIFYSCAGKRSKQLGQPVGLCFDPLYPGGAVWVADYANHRVSKLSMEGEIVGELGECGIGTNCLLGPISVAVFSDGLLAVSQQKVMRNIVLLSPEGKEIRRLCVDYSPCGLLVIGDLLIVTELDQSHLRVYRRRM